ncbi:hypothetical protein C8R48DRAFT_830902 [Suillus tomentosus]|nr:hypothetical protein C8R48DRAFT_763828 [Suillus tomentosus]KAG1876117.1 hypothetical protein C8R48DRAFT_830902 [Suillus tomentosus]
MQVPMPHPFLLLVAFNAFSQSAQPQAWLATAVYWWGRSAVLLTWTVIIDFEVSLADIRAGEGFDVVFDGEGDESPDWEAGDVVLRVQSKKEKGACIAYPAAAASSLSSTLLGVALTAFLPLVLIGFRLRRTNVVEASLLALFLAYNVWLCGFDQTSFSGPASSYIPLLSNILPHLQTLVNFITNTLPKPGVLVTLLYRLSILQVASRIFLYHTRTFIPLHKSGGGG